MTGSQAACYAIIECEDSAKWQGSSDVLMPCVFMGQAVDQAAWLASRKLYSACTGELPSIEEAVSHKVIFLTGSHYGANDDLPWVHQLTELLPFYIAAGARIVGCCFGAQILAKSLGGSVEGNPSGRFVLGIESIRLDTSALQGCGLHQPLMQSLRPTTASIASSDTASSCSGDRSGMHAEASVYASGTAVRAEDMCMSGASGPSVAVEAALSPSSGEARLCLSLLESHGDQVVALPPGAVLLGSSGTAAHELWLYSDAQSGGQALAFQFHPELTRSLILENIWPFVSQNRLSPEEAQASKQQLEDEQAGVESCSASFHALIQHFTEHGAYGSLVPRPVEDHVLNQGESTIGTSTSAKRSLPAAPASAASVQACDTTGHLISSSGSSSSCNASAVAAGAVPVALQCAAARLTEAAQAAVDASLSQHCEELSLTQQLNDTASQHASQHADATTALLQHLTLKADTAQHTLAAALTTLGDLEQQLDVLARVVKALDQQSAEVVEAATAEAAPSSSSSKQ